MGTKSAIEIDVTLVKNPPSWIDSSGIILVCSSLHSTSDSVKSLYKLLNHAITAGSYLRSSLPQDGHPLKERYIPNVGTRELQGPDACGCPFSFKDTSSLDNDSKGLCFISDTVNSLLMSLFVCSYEHWDFW